MDAQISISGLYNNPVNPADPAAGRINGFDVNQSIKSDGNHITITAVNGQEIKMHISLPNPLPAPLPLTMQTRIESYGPIMLQIGPNYNMAMEVQIPAVNAEVLGLVEYVDGKMRRMLSYLTVEGAWDAINRTDAALNFISHIRGKLGAYQNRLEQTIRSLDVASENTEIARSRIRDTDMAYEMTAYTKRNVMYQAGLAILGQANHRPQQLLSLMQ
jgi:flagellin